MLIKKCPTCKGAKEIMSLGMRVIACKTCKGIGHIEDKKEDMKVETKKVVRRAKKDAKT